MLQFVSFCSFVVRGRGVCTYHIGNFGWGYKPTGTPVDQADFTVPFELPGDVAFVDENLRDSESGEPGGESKVYVRCRRTRRDAARRTPRRSTRQLARCRGSKR